MLFCGFLWIFGIINSLKIYRAVHCDLGHISRIEKRYVVFPKIEERDFGGIIFGL